MKVGEFVIRNKYKILIAVFVALFIVLIVILSRDDNFAVQSTIDGEIYQVDKYGSTPQKSADIIATINIRIIKLLRHLKEKYIQCKGCHKKPKSNVIQFLLFNFNPDVIVENSPRNAPSKTSYTTNKGEKLHLCLKSKETGEYHDINTLMFVTLHELSHMATKQFNHVPEFWQNFKFILEEAIEIGVYKPVDYSRYPTRYCGMDITSSPLLLK